MTLGSRLFQPRSIRMKRSTQDEPNEKSEAYFSERLKFLQEISCIKLETARRKLSFWTNMDKLSKKALKDKSLNKSLLSLGKLAHSDDSEEDV